MKNATTGLLASLTLLGPAAACAELTANLGWVSDYYFRGIAQHPSSASAGIDFEHAGLYLGSWAADVGDGLEVDVYGGWSGEISDFTVGAGFTGYYYTGDFDDTYEEVNLNFGYGIASAEVAVGQYDNFAGPTQDYTYYALTLEKNGLYGKYGGFSQDFDFDYLELGYGTELEGFDLSFALIVGDDPASSETDEAIVVGIGKTFTLD